MKAGKKPQGFSLIELILAITIIGILLAIGIPSYRTWIQNSKIRAAATSISQGIQLARATAIKNNARASFDFTNSFTGTITKADWAVCSDTNSLPCLGTNVLDQFSSSGQLTNIQVEVVGGGTCIEFNGMGRRSVTARCNNANAEIRINITHPTAGTCVENGGDIRCLRVTSTRAGTTRMCDPSQSRASNPAGCL